MAERNARPNRLYQLSLSRPILVTMALLAIAVLLRIVDIFLLPIAEATGEAILHKALGLVLVLVYVWAAGRSLAAIGLHGRLLGKAAFIGASGAAMIFILSFGIQWAVLFAAGKQPALVIAAVDNVTGLAKSGVGFALWLLLGNLVNASMEEGLFRGVMLPHFCRRLRPWPANLLQAAIFGLWHLAWPIHHWLSGQMDLAAAASQAVPWVLGATISGLFYGYLFLKTDSLWAPWIAHAINNTVFNLLHIRTVGGLDADTGILFPLAALGYLVLLLWIKVWAKRLRMPELGPWGASVD